MLFIFNFLNYDNLGTHVLNIVCHGHKCNILYISSLIYLKTQPELYKDHRWSTSKLIKILSYLPQDPTKFDKDGQLANWLKLISSAIYFLFFKYDNLGTRVVNIVCHGHTCDILYISSLIYLKTQLNFTKIIDGQLANWLKLISSVIYFLIFLNMTI